MTNLLPDNNLQSPPPLPRRRKKPAAWIFIVSGIAILLFGSLVTVYWLLVKDVVSGVEAGKFVFNGGFFDQRYSYGYYGTSLADVDGMVMVYVPEGDFFMGSPDGIGESDEHPMNSFHLAGYWIDQIEVTNGMYGRCVAAGGCREPVKTSSVSHTYYYGNPEYDDYPVVNVSMYQAQEYCLWAGRTLPSEPHWERAARGESDYPYPWGYDEPDCALANYEGCSGDTEKVRSHLDAPGYYGTFDMAGNAAEWTISGYFTYPTTDALDWGPVDSTDARMIRGGGWNSPADLLRTAAREVEHPGKTNNATGFRCILPDDFGGMMTYAAED